MPAVLPKIFLVSKAQRTAFIAPAKLFSIRRASFVSPKSFIHPARTKGYIGVRQAVGCIPPKLNPLPWMRLRASIAYSELRISLAIHNPMQKRARKANRKTHKRKVLKRVGLFCADVGMFFTITYSRTVVNYKGIAAVDFY